jgi:hypothetical protein
MEEVEAIFDPAIELPDDVEPTLADILPQGYLSVSQASMVLKCPHSWFLKYVELNRGAASARMFQGIQVHRAVEHMLETLLYTGALPRVDVSCDVYSDTFNEQLKLIDDWEGQTQGEVKDLGIKCTKIYHQEASGTAMPVNVEKTFHTVITTFTSDGTKILLPVLGRIDSVQVQAFNEQEYQDIREKVAPVLVLQKEAGAKLLTEPKLRKPLRLHDLKVVTNKWNVDKIKNSLQFMLYAGVEHIPDVQVDQVVKGRAKVPKPRYEALTSVMTPADVNHGINVLGDVAKTIALGHFPKCDPSCWWCSAKWCSMHRFCRGK